MDKNRRRCHDSWPGAEINQTLPLLACSDRPCVPSPQRIPAGGDDDKMKFFGQSIHGVMDLNGDGITDVTIGGLGGASLFW